MREHDQDIAGTLDGPLSRRGFALFGAAALVGTGFGALLMQPAAAREAEPGDDHGGHGNDDPPGDDHGGHGNDDRPGDNHRHRRRRRRGHN